jgi:hypothetical protein
MLTMAHRVPSERASKRADPHRESHGPPWRQRLAASGCAFVQLSVGRALELSGDPRGPRGGDAGAFIRRVQLALERGGHGDTHGVHLRPIQPETNRSVRHGAWRPTTCGKRRTWYGQCPRGAHDEAKTPTRSQALPSPRRGRGRTRRWHEGLV